MPFEWIILLLPFYNDNCYIVERWFTRNLHFFFSVGTKRKNASGTKKKKNRKTNKEKSLCTINHSVNCECNYRKERCHMVYGGGSSRPHKQIIVYYLLATISKLLFIDDDFSLNCFIITGDFWSIYWMEVGKSKQNCLGIEKLVY